MRSWREIVEDAMRSHEERQLSTIVRCDGRELQCSYQSYDGRIAYREFPVDDVDHAIKWLGSKRHMDEETERRIGFLL